MIIDNPVINKDLKIGFPIKISGHLSLAHRAALLYAFTGNPNCYGAVISLGPNKFSTMIRYFSDNSLFLICAGVVTAYLSPADFAAYMVSGHAAPGLLPISADFVKQLSARHKQ